LLSTGIVFLVVPRHWHHGETVGVLH
jgi:hypothetical protein